MFITRFNNILHGMLLMHSGMNYYLSVGFWKFLYTIRKIRRCGADFFSRRFDESLQCFSDVLKNIA